MVINDVDSSFIVQQLNLFDELFQASGRQAILFFYQEAEAPVSGINVVQTSPESCLMNCYYVCFCFR